MLAALAVLSLAVAGLLFILGLGNYGRRLLVFGLALALLAPFLVGALGVVGATAQEYADVSFVLLSLVPLALVVVGWLRYRYRRRELEHAYEPPPTSLKRRVEHDL